MIVAVLSVSLVLVLGPSQGPENESHNVLKLRPQSEEQLSQDPEHCVQLLQPLFTEGTLDAPLTQQLGRCFRLLGDTSRSEEVLRSCVSSNPGYEPCFNDLGALLLQCGDRRTARRFLERAVELACATNSYSFSFEWAVTAALDDGDHESARRYLQLASRLAPDRTTEAHLNVLGARLALTEGNGKEALKHIQVACVQEDTSFNHLLKALVLAWNGDVKIAATELQNADFRFPKGNEEFPEIARMALTAFSKRGDPKHLLVLARRYGSHQYGWFIAAVGAELTGHHRSACSILSEAIHHVKGSRSLLSPPWIVCRKTNTMVRNGR